MESKADLPYDLEMLKKGSMIPTNDWLKILP